MQRVFLPFLFISTLAAQISDSTRKVSDFDFDERITLNVVCKPGNYEDIVHSEGFNFTGEDSISTIQQENNYYNSLGYDAEDYYDLNNPAVMDRNVRSACNLNKMVFGWHPYWQNGYEDNYQWNLVSDFCYFSYEVNPNTGGANSTHSWATINSVDTALAKGLDVHLCVTLFGGSNLTTFLTNPTAKNNLIQNLISTVSSRGAHGINIDFEGLPSSQSTNFTNFMIALCDSVHSFDPNMEVSVCLYAVDWSNVFNEPVLSNYVDFFTIMGYDYYYSGSSTAGPTDPLYGFSNTYDRSLSRTITYYLDAGIPEDKLVLGLPYYGKEWETTSNSIPSSTTGNHTYNRTYRYIKNNSTGFYTGPVWNTRSVSKAYVFLNGGTWRQAWISEEYDMEKRYDFVNRRNIKGIAIWTLGYDDGYTALWDAIEKKFTDCSVVPCTDTIYDMGGPEVDYYNDEEYAYTISPDNATQVNLNFLSFETEAGYDTLFIYDGPDVFAPLIGAYEGTNSPGLVSSSGPDLTLRFKSDGGTRAPGWMAIWTCVQDNTPPTTQIDDPGLWITQDETLNFTDNDNINVQYSFWNVADLNNGHWYANQNEGFYFDQFTEFSTDWTTATGSWTLNVGTVLQSDEGLTNTNMYVSLNQDNFNQYLYSWKGKTGGSGSNRRSGLHIMCDNPTLPNRGNSYFVWFRVDQSQLQFYKVISDTYYLEQTYTLTTLPDVWYDYQVVYDKVTGRIDVYVDGAHIGYYQDPTPYVNGNSISFRSGNASYEVDDLVVYRSRTSSELVSAGTASSMLRYENPHPDTSAGAVRSIVIDDTWLTGADTMYLNVDFTAPIGSGVPTELNPDQDTIMNVSSFLEYTDVFDDPNSDLNQLFYGIGSAPNLDNVIPYTSFSAIDSIIISTTGLINGAYYYVSLYAENNALLISDTLSSDGFLFINTTGITSSSNDLIKIYPNPVTTTLMIETDQDGWVEVMDTRGRILLTFQVYNGVNPVDISSLASGYYFLTLGNKRYKICVTH